MNSTAIDTNEFFRQVTIRICGSLDIEKAMTRCLKYIARYLPANGMVLQLLREDLNAIEIIAEVDLTGGIRLERFIPLPEEILEDIENRWLNLDINQVRIINRPEDYEESRITTTMINKPDMSIMAMKLQLEGQSIGVAAVVTDGKDQYTIEHARLLNLLHEPFAVAMSNVLRYQQLLQLKERLEDDNLYLHQELMSMSGDEIIGAEFGLKRVMEMVRQVAALNSPVLLLGETGVGKEVVANAIHYSSDRRDGPFIKVNCGAIPESLIDSELFGHEKGAFTGAGEMKRGRFERAQKGTIFLDEIGELPLAAQVRLLRVIQNREIERLGGTRTVSVDVRIISATHRNLEDMVKSGEFREDLFFRINVFPITIPPLRQRKEDIPAFVDYFVRKKAVELRLESIPDIRPETVAALVDYPFKGNIRELENMVERALILHQGGPLALGDPGMSVPIQTESSKTRVRSAGTILTLDEINKAHIQKALSLCRGKIHGPDGAAQHLDIHPNTLRKRMDKLGIDYKKRG